MVCQECNSLLCQFEVFKQTVRENNCFVDANENLTKVKLFLEENENEEVSCLRYNKCLTLVPNSKRSFIETLKNWQPHILLDKISEPPPAKIKKPNPEENLEPEPDVEKESSIEDDMTQITTEEALEIEVIDDNLSIKYKDEEILENDEDNSQDELTEEEWLKMEMEGSEIVLTEDGEMESWVCNHCDPPERYFDSNDFRNHLLSIHLHCEQIVYEDGEVNEEFELSSQETDSYQIQEQISKLIVARKVKKIFDCPNCEFSTEDRDNFRHHEKIHFDKKLFLSSRFEKMFCIDCSYQFTSHAHYQAHVNGHQLYEIVSKYASHPICELCNLMFCDESYAAIHQDQHDSQEELVDQIIPAEGFFLKLGHYRPDEVDEPENVEQEYVVKCGHCNKKFQDEESCRLHQLIFHTRILKCPLENRIFKGNQAFSIHMRNNHPELFGEIKFPCSVCKLEFDTLYEKLSHMKTCDKKKYQCTHCDKKFSQKCYLKSHLQRISGQTSVVCEICQKVCRDKGDYQIHFRSHSNLKPFKCSICPKAYKTSSARAAHIEIHMEKGFNCSVCDAKFKARRTLQKHVKVKHHQKRTAKNEEELDAG